MSKRIQSTAAQAPRQRGMSLISFVVVLTVAGLFGTLTLRLVPVYLNNYKIKTSLEAIKSQPELAAKSRGEILGSIQKRWDVDSVSDATINDVIVTKSPEELQVRVTYDVVRPFVSNIDVVVHFDEAIEVNLR